MHYSEFSFVLKPSLIAGVGVFATHDIPVGTVLFTTGFGLRVLKTKDIPADLIKYCIYLNDDECICPERFDHLEIGWYINHSATPNIAREATPYTPEELADVKARPVFAIRDIKAGEEIFIDYNYLNEPEHLKEDYYKK